MVKSRDKSAESEQEELRAELRGLHATAFGTIRMLLEGCERRAKALGAAAGKGGEGFDKDLCIAAGQLAKTVVSLEAEQRQGERAARAAMEGLSIQKILAYLRQAPPSERRAVARELGEIDQGGGVLG